MKLLLKEKLDSEEDMNHKIVLYVNTIPFEPRNSFTCESFCNVKHDYLHDLSKLEHYLDLVYDNGYNFNYDFIKIVIGDPDTIPNAKEWLEQLYSIILQDKYIKYANDVELSKHQNTEFVIECTSNIQKYITIEEAIDKNLRFYIDCTVDEIDDIEFRSILKLKHNLYKDSIKLRNKFSSYQNNFLYAFFIDDVTDSAYYELYKSGGLYKKQISFFYSLSKKLRKRQFNLEKSKFFKFYKKLDFDTKLCSTYSLNDGTDLINDIIVKCSFGYDVAPRIELTDENFIKLIEREHKFLIPEYTDSNVCASCVYYKKPKDIFYTKDYEAEV